MQTRELLLETIHESLQHFNTRVSRRAFFGRVVRSAMHGVIDEFFRALIERKPAAAAVLALPPSAGSPAAAASPAKAAAKSPASDSSAGSGSSDPPSMSRAPSMSVSAATLGGQGKVTRLSYAVDALAADRAALLEYFLQVR